MGERLEPHGVRARNAMGLLLDLQIGAPDDAVGPERRVTAHAQRSAVEASA
ncbi:hypothetical protein D3C83_162870 [compost metagenome]